MIPTKMQIKSSFKILKNFKPNLKPKKMLFFVARLPHYCEFKAEHAFPNQSFLRPCTARCVLSCPDITYFISASVVLDRRFNTASKKEYNTDGMSIHFLIKSFLKTTLFPLTQIISMKRIRLLSYY